MTPPTVLPLILMTFIFAFLKSPAKRCVIKAQLFALSPCDACVLNNTPTQQELCHHLSGGLSQICAHT